VLAFALGVFVVLLAQFRRARLAVVVLLSVRWPCGASSARRDWHPPTSSMMGALLVGLVVKNGILLLEQAESSWTPGRPARRLARGRLDPRAPHPS
jgi:multidrug efflux pump subunit AcrB